MKRAVLIVAAVLAIAGPVARSSQRDPSFVQIVDPVIEPLWSGFDRRAALEHVRFVSQFWRLGGNAGFDAAIDRVHARLAASGFVDRGAAGGAPGIGTISVDEYPNTAHGWDYSVGTLALVRDGQPDQAILSKESHQIALCINSFSTPLNGVVAPIVDVGRGATDQDFAGKDVTRAVVMGDADPAALWRRAVAHGAIGIVSTSLGSYINPDPPGAPARPRETWDILQWGSIPYDADRRGFGFKASPKAAAEIRRALARGTSRPSVRVTVASTFSTRPVRTLVAEISGRVLPNERIVIAAHVQEPGANDNASGVATLTELARVLQSAIQRGAIPRPDRTITMLWLEEISGSRQWLKDHAAEAKGVRHMFSIDMTGEDVTKTGGTFLIERWPDPGAVWDRPWDPHSEWGRGSVRADQLHGDLLNDEHRAVCERVGSRTGWVVRTNPYEGGSDHTVFGTAGVPAVLNWHFTDRYYHSNYDTVDKTSPEEMRNVGVSVAASAWLLASSGESTALAIADLVADAGAARVALEQREGAKLAEAAADPAAARVRETAILQAWKQWYREAVRSAERMVQAPDAAFAARLDRLARRFD